ncbi:MAG: hypothetical protein AAGA80_02970 [Cyanobacteria bacterium P01_F01_bin.143]
MFKHILEELTKLIKAIDFISDENAKELVTSISLKIREELGACTVDLLWKETKEKIYGGTYLKVFLSETNSGRGRAEGRFVNQESFGIWSKVYREGKPIWIEGIQSKQHDKYISGSGNDNSLREGYIRLTEPLENKKGGRIESSDLVFYEDIDTIIVIPLSYRDTIWGVYSIELERYQRNIEPNIFKEISDLVQAMAIVIWKSDVETQNLKDTSQAIADFKKSIIASPITTRLNTFRIGLIVRPFNGEEFEYVQDYLNKYLHKKGIHLSHYSHPPSQGIVINSLMEEIKRTHFGVADITGNSPNCLLELGMMMILGKQFLILKRKDDETEVPFDISAYQYYKYEMQGPSLLFFEPGKRNSLEIDQVLDLFIKRLEKNKSFSEAKPYKV